MTNNKGKNKGWNWTEIKKRLKTEFCKKYKFVEALHFLSNSYKHDPSMELDEELLRLLSLETGINYAPLPESDASRKGFASFIGLKEDAGLCDIAKQFVEIASNFLAEIETQTKLSKVNGGVVSFNPKDALR